METRHAQGVSFPVPTRRIPLAPEGSGRDIEEISNSVVAEPQALRLHGRHASASKIEVAGVGEDELVERGRAALRFDRRGPSLRLVEPAGDEVRRDPAGEIMDQVAAAVGPERFGKAFDGQARIAVNGSTIEIRAVSRASAGLIERRFGSVLSEAAVRVLGSDARVNYVVVPVVAPIADGTPTEPAAAVASPRREAAARSTVGEPRSRTFRLEEFVVGESNRLAYNATMQMADGELGDGRIGAPLFIHGPCGVGKTHLLHGLGQRFRERHPGATVRVVSGEMFLNEFVAAVRHGGGSSMTGQSRSVAGAGGIERFRRQYRRCDLLCIDDVHFLASKQATQQELLHTFDQIAQSGARIVLACDQHPRQMKSGDGGFSPALVSRFLSGMVAGIDPPDATVRERAARMFAQRRGLNLEEGALRMLVERSQTLPGHSPISVRDLEGILTRVEAVHRLGTGGQSTSGTVGVLVVERAFGMVGDDRSGSSSPVVRRPIRAEQIIAHTCMALGVERSDLSASTRHKRVVLARAVITHLCRELTTMSFPEIARAIGRPSHSTVITAHQRLTKQIAADEVFGIGPGGEAMTVGGLVRQLAASLVRG